VITLDTDTQLPRDTAAKMVAAMAHPLNRPILDPATNTVTEGYALLRPQVAISVDSAHRSWIARIFSGQPGFDPYSRLRSPMSITICTAQASFTGKGIYDVRTLSMPPSASAFRRTPSSATISLKASTPAPASSMSRWWKIIPPLMARFRNANTAGCAAIGSCFRGCSRILPF
jgi:hypothetical protein